MKHLRIISKKLGEEFPGIKINKVRHRTHAIYELQWGGCCRNLSIAVSPKNADHCIHNAVQDARVLFRNVHVPSQPARMGTTGVHV